MATYTNSEGLNTQYFSFFRRDQTDVDTETLTLSGLDGDYHGAYEFFARLKFDRFSTLDLMPNNSNTGLEALIATDGGSAVVDSGRWRLIPSQSTLDMTITIYGRLESARETDQKPMNRGGVLYGTINHLTAPNYITSFRWDLGTIDSSSNWTSLVLSGSAAGSIEAGSYMQVVTPRLAPIL